MSTTTASFLGLPVELRLPVYKLVFNRYDGIHTPNILLVNRQVRSEAFQIYLEWTRYFNSFEYLIEWTTKGNPQLLEHVGDVSFQIRDSNWKSLMSAAIQASEEANCEITEAALGAAFVELNTAAEWKKRFGQVGDSLAAEPPAREDTVQGGCRLLRQARELRKKLFSKSQSDAPPNNFIEEIWKALQRMPNVRCFWVNLASQDLQKEPLMRLVLEMISVAFPRMSSFTFFSHLHTLDFLHNFEHLRHLRFTGRSTSTPEELLEIILSLKSLDSMSLYRYPELYDPNYGVHGVTSEGRLSLDESVITRMRPLASLEISHMTSRLSSAFLTVSMLQAWKSHLPSLRVLKVGTDERLGVAAITELLNLIALSSLTKLQIRSQGDKKPLDISTYLPPSIKHYEGALKCDEFKGTGSSGASCDFMMPHFGDASHHQAKTLSRKPALLATPLEQI